MKKRGKVIKKYGKVFTFVVSGEKNIKASKDGSGSKKEREFQVLAKAEVVLDNFALIREFREIIKCSIEDREKTLFGKLKK